MGTDSYPPRNDTSQQYHKHSGRMDTPSPFPHMASTEARGDTMDSCPTGILPYTTTSPPHANEICRLHASRALESTSHAAPPTTSRKLLRCPIAEAPLGPPSTIQGEQHLAPVRRQKVIDSSGERRQHYPQRDATARRVITVH